MKLRQSGLAVLVLGVLAVSQTVMASDDAASSAVQRGRYLVEIGGCNDCHTAGYIDTNGQVPEAEWLEGNAVGWKGPWGTTYPPNLRLSLSTKSEEEWISFARNLRARPPMPWFAFEAMSDDDLKDIYSFVRQLQPLGEPAPDYLPVDKEPPLPYFEYKLPAAQ